MGEIKFIALVLCILFISLEVKNEAVSASSTVKLNKHKKLIVISYDGFRFDFNLNKTDTPNLDKLRQGGAYTQYMIPQFPSKTFPNHQSIATGLHSESHGIIDNSAFDPKYGRIVSGYKEDDEFWNFNDDVAPVWIWNEWSGDGRFSGVQFPGSDHPYGKNLTLPTHYLHYNKSRTFESRVDYVIKWLTDPEKPANLVLMYFDEPDSTAHAYGPNSPQVKKAIERMDNITGYLIDQLKKFDILHEANIIVLSDHGFEEVTFRKSINISIAVDHPDLYTNYGRSPIIQILPKPDKFTEVYESFKSISNGQNFSVYKKEEFPKKFHYGNNRRIMPIVLVADPGYVFDDQLQSYKKKFNLTEDPDLDHTMFGVHGYDNGYENMHAFFLAYGPSFKKGFEVKPFENIDLFPLMCKILGIPTPPNNGSLIHVNDLLAESESNSAITSKRFITYSNLFILSLIGLLHFAY